MPRDMTDSNAAQRSRGFAALIVLLAVILIAAQSAAVAHEIEHVLHLHSAACALHVAADHLSVVPVPDSTPAVALAPAAAYECSGLHALSGPPVRPSAARAPPFLS